MTTLRNLCNIPKNKYLLMEMFENGKKVAEQGISNMTCRELKWMIEYQEDLGRAWSYKTVEYPYAEFVGMQEDVGDRPAIPIYNIIGGPKHGSTVSKQTLIKLDIEIP